MVRRQNLEAAADVAWASTLIIFHVVLHGTLLLSCGYLSYEGWLINPP